MSKCLVITAILKVIWNSQHLWPIYVEKTIENLIWRYEMHLVVLKGWFACIYQHWIYIYSYEVFEELLGVNEL